MMEPGKSGHIIIFIPVEYLNTLHPGNKTPFEGIVV